MAKKSINSWKDCRYDDRIDKAVVQAGGKVREAAGSHKIAEIDGHGSMTYYHPHNGGEISTGVAVKVFKWLKRAGIVALFIGFPLWRLYTYYIDGILTF